MLNNISSSGIDNANFRQFSPINQKIVSSSIEPKSDSVSFLEMYCDLKENKEKSLNGYVAEGKINNQDASIKEVPDTDIKLKQVKVYCEGSIGDKKLLLESNEYKFDEYPTKYTGEYNGKKVDLNLDIDNGPNKIKRFFMEEILGKTYLPKYCNIEGTIGDKEVNLKIPNGSVPRDSDTKDVIATILYNHTLSPKIINGKIINLSYDNETIKEIISNSEERDKKFNEDVKPIIMETLSMIGSVAVPAAVTFLAVKLGLKTKE